VVNASEGIREKASGMLSGWICISMIAITLISLLWQCDYAWTYPMNEHRNRLIIVYDNNAFKNGLVPAWGFSCLIILPGYGSLFDTGGDPSILLKNMHEMGIRPEKIDSVVLSHIHGDHVGGLSGFLRWQKRPLTVYLPISFPKNFKEEVALMGASVKEIDRSLMIHTGVHTTGQLGRGIKEQSLVLKTCKGLVIVTGCAHPGIVEIVDHARKLFKDNVYFLIGGFHLMGKSPKEIIGIAKQLDELKVERIAPCHCSGDLARGLFRHYYGKNYIECGVGLELEIPDLRE
jgi:7,8-dihydropterin-6-yl-methyl-4-(beta-D-ribofuranosyl)aminobenzene 5'-phosphate synthase